MPAVISAFEPDPSCAFARLTDVDFGIHLAIMRPEQEPTVHTLWINKEGRPMEKQSFVQTRIVDAALLRLPSVVGEMDAVEKELCDYLASNGLAKTYPELLALARHFAELIF